MKVIIQSVIEAKTWNSIQIIGKCYAEAFIYIYIFIYLSPSWTKNTKGDTHLLQS